MQTSTGIFYGYFLNIESLYESDKLPNNTKMHPINYLEF